MTPRLPLALLLLTCTGLSIGALAAEPPDKSAPTANKPAMPSGRKDESFWASKLAVQSLERLYPTSRFPDGHPALAEALEGLAILHRNQGDYAGAQPLFERALAMKEKLYPASRYPQGHHHLAEALSNLALLHEDREDYDRALPLLERALSMYESLYPVDRFPQGHADVIRSLNNLAELHWYQNDYAKQLPLRERALTLCERLYPKDQFPQGHATLADSLNKLAVLYHNQKDYDLARPLYERALAMNEALYPTAKYPLGHADVALVVTNLGNLHRDRSDYGQALQFYERALAMRRSLYPKEKFPNGHPQLISSLRSLAKLHRDRGDNGRAQLLYEQALAISESLYPKTKYPQGHGELVSALNDLADLCEDRGEYRRALSMYEHALRLNESLYPKDKFPFGNSQLATSLMNLGWLQQQFRGDYAQAMPLYERALVMQEALYPRHKYPDGHAELARTLNHLAVCHRNRGDYERALPLCERSLAINEAIFPNDKYPSGHDATATSLNNLGLIYQDQQDFDRALPPLQRALAIREVLYSTDKYPNGNSILALTISNLALVHRQRGDYDRALELYQRALAIYERLYPADRYPQGHRDMFPTLNNLAFLHHARREYTEASKAFTRILAAFEAQSNILIASAAEAEALNHLASLPAACDGFLSLPHERLGTSAALQYRWVWRGKAQLARLFQRRHRETMAAADPEVRKSHVRLQETRRRLAALLVAPAIPSADRVAEIKGLNDTKERLEREIAAKLTATARPEAAPADLAARLPTDAVFVDLLHYFHFDYNPNKPGTAGDSRTPSYLAFILVPGKAVQRVDLGPAEPIDAAVTAWRGAIEDRRTSSTALELRRLVWEPIAKLLPAETKTIYLAPDAQLSRLPWAALPGGKPGSVLLEDYALAVVSSGPALLDFLRPRERRAADTSALLTLGGVAYDGGAPINRVAVLRGTEPNRAVERGGPGNWSELERTGAEAERVAKQSPSGKVVSLSGTSATAERLLAELPKARWAHLATHGFFADSRFRSVFQLDEKLYERSSRDRATPGARNPLVRSGLVLSGANSPTPDGDGGILTAEAIVGLPLEGLDLAVLSACETGLGEVAGGEGVFGLQRAFHLAGCRDVVASLWNVGDESTAALMGVFYRKLWQEKLPPIEALRQAQLAIYRSSPEEIKDLATRSWDVDKTVKIPEGGTASAKRGRAPVKQWAAFMLSGPGN